MAKHLKSVLMKSAYFLLVAFMTVLFSNCSVSKRVNTDKVATQNRIRIESGEFDEEKPTIVFFGGGNCESSWEGTELWENNNTNGSEWFKRANVISFYSYRKDNSDKEDPVYFEASKMAVDFILESSPNYDKDVQSCGFSTGGSPALDFAIFVNTSGKDIPFRITNVSLMDSPCYDYKKRIDKLMKDDDPLLIVNLIGELFHEFKREPYPGTLNVDVLLGHDEVFWWYVNSLNSENGNEFNDGIVGDSYLSVLGEGSGIRIPYNPELVEYYFNWSGDIKTGEFSYYNKEKYPLKLD